MRAPRGAAGRPLPSPLFDAHVHLMPERLAHAVWRYFDQHLWRVRYQLPVDELVATLRAETGVTGFVFMNYAHRAAVAQSLNRWNAELAARIPGAVPLATFHPDDADLERLVEEAWGALGLAGAKLHCQVGRFAPDDPRLDPVYERAVALRKPIVLHVGRAPEPSPFCGAERFAALMRRFPDLRAIVAHMGADEFEAFFALARQYEHVYLDTTLVYADLLDWRPRLELVAKLQDRVLFGSDFPAIPYPVCHAIAAWLALGLGRDAEQKIFWGNAARLYGLAPEQAATR